MCSTAHFGESFEMWCWSGEGQLDRSCGNEEVLRRVKEARNTIKRRKANWNWYELHSKHIIEGKIEGRIEVTR
jgi:hypothetical protein